MKLLIALVPVSGSYHRDTNKDEWHSVRGCHGDAGTAVLLWRRLRVPSVLSLWLQIPKNLSLSLSEPLKILIKTVVWTLINE